MRGDPSIRVSPILWLLLATRLSAAAEAPSVDIVTTRDGSILKGKITRVENDKLVIDTDFAGDVVVDVEKIDNLASEQYFSVGLLNGQIVAGYLAVSNGKIVLREELPSPREPMAPQGPKSLEKIELPAMAPEVTGPPHAPGVEAIVQRASPAAEDSLQAATRDDLARDESAVELAESTDGGPSETPAITERADTRTFSFGDVDWIRVKPPYFRYDAEFNTGVQLARGNTDTTDLHFDARLEPHFGWNTIRLSGEYDKKTADGDTTTNHWSAAAVYERDFRRRWFVSASNSYESDAQRDLDLRIIAATGVGYRIYDDKPTFLSVLPALAYVNENFTGNSDDTDYVAFQLNTDFKRDLYKDDITLFNNNMYLNNLQSLSDIIVETRTGLEFDMPWDLALSAEFQADWDNEPAAGTKKLDTRYMLKIGFEFNGDEEDWFQ